MMTRRRLNRDTLDERASAYGVSVPVDDSSPRLLSPNDIGKILNVTGEAVKQWIHQRRLPAVKLDNGYWKVKVEDFESFLKSRRSVPQLRVLIADLPNRHGVPEIVAAVEQLGYQACIAHNYADALLKALDHHPALIVINLSQKETEPWKLAEKIRATKQLKHLPILLLSDSNLTGSAAEKALDISAQAFLRRPFKADTLAKEVRRIMNIEK